MRISSRAKATALFLLVSLQCTFAAVDVALCSSALCFPKTSGVKSGDVKKVCSDGYDLGKDDFGKAACVRKVALPCPFGTTLKDGKCCDSSSSKSCSPMLPGHTCPEGLKAMKDCPSVDNNQLVAGTSSSSSADSSSSSRKLMGDNPLVKEINIVGTNIVPNMILPKPAISFTVRDPPKKEQPKITLPSMMVPQIILPESPITLKMPDLPNVGPAIKFEGNPSIIPNIVPILPEPLVTVSMPKDAIPDGPKVNTDITTKTMTIDLSKVGPKNTLDINLPAMPDIIGQLTKLPDIDVMVPDAPKVIDLSGLGPKKSLDITLPEVKLPKQGSLTIVNSGSHDPQFLDLTGLGPKNKTGVNIQLPSLKGDGATFNIIADTPEVKDIVLPGNGGLHKTTINMPDWPNHPEKTAKLVVDVKSTPLLDLDSLNAAKNVNVTKVSLALPAIDLSKMHPDGPDVVVDIKPLLKFNASLTSKDKPEPVQVKRVDIKMKDIEIPKLLNDTTIHIKPLPMDVTKLIPKKMLDVKEDRANTSDTVINLPANTLPKIPIPAGKTDFGVHLPLKLGLSKNAANASVTVSYQEEWSGGEPTLPNPSAKMANALGKMLNAITTATCPTKCCKDEEVAECQEQQYKLDILPVKSSCEDGYAYNALLDKCLSVATVSDCPQGLSKCSIAGKGVCVPDVDGKFGIDACAAFKAVCSNVGVIAQSC